MIAELRRFWSRHFLLLEWASSVIISLSAIVWMERFGGLTIVNDLLDGSRAAIYGALATIFGSLLGFIITAVSIALGFSTSDRLAIVRDSKYYLQLWGVFISATRCLALATVASVVALVGDRDSAPIRWLTYSVLILSVLAVTRIARCIWVLENIVRIVVTPRRATDKGNRSSTALIE